jgi:glyoxalase family protein
MQLEGIHHVTAITGDAQRNVDFYVETMGLRLVKKTVNFDAPDVYHLYFGDDAGAPGSVMTFFEVPGARQGRHGAGMVHTVVWRVAGDAALDFWAARLEQAGRPVERVAGGLRSADPEGMGIELLAVDVADPPLAAAAPDIPREHALLGIHGVRAYAREPQRSERLLATLGFAPADAGPALHQVAQGEARHGIYVFDPAPPDPGVQGAGSVHHVAWASQDDDLERWGEAVRRAGGHPTSVRDRSYFRSIYFREPSGVLFELATLSPGFAVDEPAESLGERLMLPERYEPRRSQLERALTPLRNPRAGRATA